MEETLGRLQSFEMRVSYNEKKCSAVIFLEFFFQTIFYIVYYNNYEISDIKLKWCILTMDSLHQKICQGLIQNNLETLLCFDFF